MFQVVLPLSFISFSTRPSILPLTTHLILKILSNVDASIGKDLIAFPVPLIQFPVSIITLTIEVEHNSLPLSFALHKLSKIHGFFVLLQFEIGRLLERLDVEVGRLDVLKEF